MYLSTDFPFNMITVNLSLLKSVDKSFLENLSASVEIYRMTDGRKTNCRNSMMEIERKYAFAQILFPMVIMLTFLNDACQ